MILQYLPDGSPECPLIRHFDFTPSEIAVLGACIADMIAGRVERVLAHELPKLVAEDCVGLVLRIGDRDQGIKQLEPFVFECRFTLDTWKNVIELIKPFADGEKGYQWLSRDLGEASWLISVSGRW